MNYYAYKFTENDHGYFFYFLSPFDGKEIDLVQESVEHYISNEPSDMNKYLMSVNFDEVKIERVIGVTAMDIINNSFPSDPKCMNVSTEYVSLIPPPKPKRQPKAKAQAKPSAQ